MKVLVHGVEKNLIPYKGNPNLWYDGVDENNVFSFGELVFPTTVAQASEVVTKAKVNIGVKGSVKKTKKPAKKTSKKVTQSKKL